MKQVINNIIVDIHENDDIKGTFIEIGAGQPLAKLLFDVGGSSNTINETHSYYSKDSQDRIKGNSDSRSVSYQSVKEILLKQYYKNEVENKNINDVVFVSSFQIGSNKTNHGWIGIKGNSKTKFYHVTIPYFITRIEMIEWIGELSLELFVYHYNMEYEYEYLKFVDIIRDLHEEDEYLEDNLDLMNSESILTINANGTMCRLEDVFRTKKVEPVIVYKGSFNPIHDGHIEIAKLSQELYPDSPLVFSISLNTFGKGLVDKQDLVNRIKNITAHGFNVIITIRPLFTDTLHHLKFRLINDIIFPVGYDTLERFYETDFEIYEKTNTKILVFNRGDEEKIKEIDKTKFHHCVTRMTNNIHLTLSSTEIREKNKKQVATK